MVHLTESAGTLPRLPIPFAIIAGGRGTSVGYNPLLSGDDDGVVKIDEAYLGRAEDFLRVDAVHGFLVSDTKAIDAVIRFMKIGWFRTKQP